MTAQEKTNCPLCHGNGEILKSFSGYYDQSEKHYTYNREFYQCDAPSCGAVFFHEELVSVTDDPHWQNELAQYEWEHEIVRHLLTESEPYKRMVRGKEEKDKEVTQDRLLRTEVKEMDTRIAVLQERIENFHSLMRNFAWDDPEGIQAWVEESKLPPNFTHKEVDTHFRMSQPWRRPDTPERADGADGSGLLKQGQSILHKSWGTGCVIQGNSNGGTMVTVEFSKAGKKKLDLRYAGLQIVG